jgi:hypothetical protein
MEHYLNAAQTGRTYSVFNLSTPWWIAFQEFVALQLWGAQFDPDWIVTMDGWSDAIVGCEFSQGVGNPMYFPTMRSYVHGYLQSTEKPIFYRGWLENELIRHSAAYRALTGKEVVEQEQLVETNTGGNLIRRQGILTKIGEARDMLAFYVGTYRGILKLYPNAKYIISTQPGVATFAPGDPAHGDFGNIYDHPAGSEARARAIETRERELEEFLTAHQDEVCGKRWGVAFNYVYVNGAIRLERLAQKETARGHHVEYQNAGLLFPKERAERVPYFIDTPHLSDKGMDVLGKFYAERILLADGTARP